MRRGAGTWNPGEDQTQLGPELLQSGSDGTRIRVLLAHPHAVLRAGLERLLEDGDEVVVAAEAETGLEVLTAVRDGSFDVVVLGLAFPDRCGLDVIKQLHHARPDLPMLVVSARPEAHFGLRCLLAGAAGFVGPDCPPGRLPEAVRKASTGGRYLGPTVAEALAEHLQGGPPSSPVAALSDRELQVLTNLAQGRTPTEIASALCLSAKTVSSYRSRLLAKLGLGSTAALIRFAIEVGLA